MANETIETRDVDRQVAATLAAALIVRGFTLPAATNTTMAAAQAVEIYRFVVERLRSADLPVSSPSSAS
jgi:hypothetical protein